MEKLQEHSAKESPGKEGLSHWERQAWKKGPRGVDWTFKRQCVLNLPLVYPLNQGSETHSKIMRKPREPGFLQIRNYKFWKMKSTHFKTVISLVWMLLEHLEKLWRAIWDAKMQGAGMQGARMRVHGCRVQGWGYRVQGWGCRGARCSDAGCKVQRWGCKDTDNAVSMRPSASLPVLEWHVVWFCCLQARDLIYASRSHCEGSLKKWSVSHGALCRVDFQQIQLLSCLKHCNAYWGNGMIWPLSVIY